jgi:hypothetical protein
MQYSDPVFYQVQLIQEFDVYAVAMDDPNKTEKIFIGHLKTDEILAIYQSLYANKKYVDRLEPEDKVICLEIDHGIPLSRSAFPVTNGDGTILIVQPPAKLPNFAVN